MSKQMNITEKLAQCRTPELPYVAWHEDADRRTERGEEQVFCLTCERWQWRDQKCELLNYKATPIPVGEIIRDARWPQFVWLEATENGFVFHTRYSQDAIQLPAEIRLYRIVEQPTP